MQTGSVSNISGVFSANFPIHKERKNCWKSSRSKKGGATKDDW
jgi:hypothetical protein